MNADNVLTIKVGSTKDLTKIPVYLVMTNDVAIQALQASFALPNNLGQSSFNKDDAAADTYCVLGERAGKNHIKNTEEMFTNSKPCDLLLSVTPGMGDDMFAIGSDVVATFTFDGSSLSDGTYSVKLYHAFLVTSAGKTRYNSPDCEVSFTINRTVLGDANSDGKVDVGDLSSIVGYILNTNIVEGFNESAADANEDGEVNVGDLSTIVKMILGTYTPSGE